jgi:hypothetical protein
MISSCASQSLRVYKRCTGRFIHAGSLAPRLKKNLPGCALGGGGGSFRIHVPCTTAVCLQYTSSVRVRSFSSRSGRDRDTRKNKNRNGFKLDALAFSVSPEEALQKFRTWAVDDQGLNYLLSWNSIRIGAAYVPVWSFDVNVRFVRSEKKSGRKRFDWKPDIFSVYGQQSVVHLPGLSAYAGHSYRRSLVNPVHNTTMVFMGSDTVPFGQWMLRDMELSNGELLSIFPDPWNTTRGRAFTVIKEELQGIASSQIVDTDVTVHVETEVLASRRVYMPTYVIDYKVFGMEYRAFLSGCDAGAGVSGISHKVFNVSSQDVHQTSHSFLTQAWSAAQTGARVFGPRQFGTFFVLFLQMFGNLAARLLLRIPIIGLLSGVVVGFRKVIQPWMDNRWASADWERQREHEAYMDDRFEHIDDFVDSGAAKRYFQANRGHVLSHLSGEYQHEKGEYEWYKEWEEWARRQWEQQQQQQQQQQGGQQQQQQQTYQKQRTRPGQKAKPDYQWDFDPNDP